ncbi:hypothetical protein HXZ91_04855 [Myroides odoratimimus]|uniref:hypothetical protein n=1 Tax=Myroides odoratimimus TaxID=76832 RepID=UPI0025766D31|nr:hypothetical protein [Myroides odoratimimus]MDM1033808.1 hypothetical protein [Myroides odoratimimus]
MTELSQCIIPFVLGFCTQYFISYFKTKGANQAHKEDKEEITRIIKEVEHKFNANLELVKVKLDNTNSILKEINSNEKEIILSTFESNFKYYDFLIDLNLSDTDIRSNDEINKYISLNHTTFSALSMNYETLKIFIPDENFEIIERLNECIDKYFEFRSLKLDFLHSLQELNVLHEDNFNSDYYDKLGPLRTEYSNSVSLFIEDIGPLLNDFTDEIRRYIKSKNIN